MHIPDGFLDAKTVVATGALAVIGVGIAVRRAQAHLPPRRIPLLGLTAAFVFAAQMVNFPVAGGTSGHLVGGVLAAVLVGPSGAVVVMTTVLIVQCLVFADGGVLALGANIFNMGIVGTVGGYAIYRVVYRAIGRERGRLVAVALGAWCSVVLAAVMVAGELSLSGVVPWSVVLPAMAGVHVLIGGGEAAITALVILAVSRARPELLVDGNPSLPVRSVGETLTFGLLIALGIALFLSPLASTWPDGLEKVAQSLGFAERTVQPSLVPSPMPDYTVSGIVSPRWAAALAGAVGTIVVFLLALGLARALGRRSAGPHPPAS
jgi:cobalt/nickel transport system permease protein